MSELSFDSKICQNIDQALKHEWSEENRFGGHVGSTIACVNTRRSHGLLVAQLSPPLDRFVLLNSLEEFLLIDEAAYPLSTLLYANTVYPQGYRSLTEFSLKPFLTWVFEIEDIVLVKNMIFMYDEQTVLVRYQIIAGDETLVRLELRPLTACRDVHSLGQQSGRLNSKLDLTAGKIRFGGIFFYHNAAIVDGEGRWYKGIQYPEERKEGRDFEEDLYAPFRLVCPFTKGREIFLCASLEDRKMVNPKALIAREDERRFQGGIHSLTHKKANHAA